MYHNSLSLVWVNFTYMFFAIGHLYLSTRLIQCFMKAFTYNTFHNNSQHINNVGIAWWEFSQIPKRFDTIISNPLQFQVIEPFIWLEWQIQFLEENNFFTQSSQYCTSYMGNLLRHMSLNFHIHLTLQSFVLGIWNILRAYLA